MKYYFKNLFRAITGKTGFVLVNSKPNTWYRITEFETNEPRCFGVIGTNKDGCFIPFIQYGDTFTWENPEYE